MCIRDRDACNNSATVSRTVTWTADNTPPVFTGSYATTDLGCNPADVNAALGTTSATDGCGAPTISSSDGAVSRNGRLRRQTRTRIARDAYENRRTVSRTVTWTADNT